MLIINNPEDYRKGLNKAKILVKKAKNERDKKGYRENLGYDSENELTNYLETLDLSFSEYCNILNQFIAMCDDI